VSTGQAYEERKIGIGKRGEGKMREIK